MYEFLLEEKYWPGEQAYSEKEKMISRLTGLKGKSMQLSLISSSIRPFALNHLLVLHLPSPQVLCFIPSFFK